jgi:NAD(P)H-dependent FMN reductase
MKITVLNGSPKGNLSVTMQYVHFIRLKFPAHQFVIHNISDHIRKIERDDMAFQEIISAVSSSDGVIWAFPLHYFLVPGPYKRFIELIWERKAEAAFRDKFATVITTSIHNYGPRGPQLHARHLRRSRHALYRLFLAFHV